MFLAGDEFGNTQYGNNNAYCQDNEISWLDWGLLEKNKELFRFFQYMMQFRMDHPAVRGDLMPSRLGFPYISLHREQPWNDDITEDTHYLGVMFAGRMDNEKEDIVYLAVNVYWEYVSIELPRLPEDKYWQVCVNTALEDEDCMKAVRINTEFVMAPRSVAVFISPK